MFKYYLKLILFVMILISPLTNGVAFAEDTVKIGVLNPLTGLYAIVGKRASQGIQMAVDEINADGGVLGMKLEALIRDSETNPDSSVRTGKRLILQDNVVALFGPLHGGAAIAVNNLAKKSLNPQYGGRPVKRVLQKEILNPLSKTLLSEKITRNKDIVIDYFGDVSHRKY